MNHNCIVKAHGAGLFSNINKVLVCMRIYDHVHVDWSAVGPNDPAYKYGQSFYGDCWDALFEPTAPSVSPNLLDIVVSYPFYDITAACAGVLYQNEQWGWRQEYHEQWQKLKCKLTPFRGHENSIGVMIRSETHGGEQLSGRSQPLEEYAQAIEAINGTAPLFVVSSDEESIGWIRNRVFPHRCVNFTMGIKRSARRSDPEQHITVPQTTEDAVMVVREILTLATCSALIHPISNMATAALYINPQLKSVYLK